MNQPHAPDAMTAASMPHQTGFGVIASTVSGVRCTLNPSEVSALA